MIKKDTKSIIMLLFLLVLSVNLNAQIGVPPNPNAGTAVVDGTVGEWNLTQGGMDWFADMHQAGQSSKPVTAYLYLRYDCETNIMYSLIYIAGSAKIIVEDGDEVWIKVDGSKVVSADDVPVNSFQPNFAWVNSSGGYADGWEGSFSLAEKTTPPYTIEAHVNIEDGGSQTSSNVYQTLVVDCTVLPVEMTSFSATISGSLAQLNWETATEVNNYGFEVQRSTEIEDWKKVGFVQGHGNSNSPKQYSFTDTEVIRSGFYSYRLKQIDIDGQFEYSDVVNINLDIEDISYELNQNYPNPFNPTTTISYTIPEQTHVDLVIYNLFGEEVARLVNEVKEPGSYTLNYTAENMASGMYFYTIKTDNYSATKKLILMK